VDGAKTNITKKGNVEGGPIADQEVIDLGGSENLIMEGAPLKEDAGREDYDLGLQLLLPAGILTAGTGDARGVTIGSPK